MTIEEEARAAIARGAKWLDGEIPGWASDIDGERLVMTQACPSERHHGCGCIGVQLEEADGHDGHFADFVERHAFDELCLPSQLGLDMFDPDDDDEWTLHHELWLGGFPEDAWRQEIAKRLEA